MKKYQKVALESKKLRESHKRMDDVLREYGLTTMTWVVLHYVNDGLKSITHIAKDLGVSLAFITNSVKVLQAHGYVAKTLHEYDRRSNSLSITDEGRKVINSLGEL